MASNDEIIRENLYEGEVLQILKKDLIVSLDLARQDTLETLLKSVSSENNKIKEGIKSGELKIHSETAFADGRHEYKDRRLTGDELFIALAVLSKVETAIQSLKSELIK